VPKLKEWSTQLQTQKDCNELSVYTDEVATRTQLIGATKKLHAAFPEITNDFIILLIERLIDNKFTKQRVTDAINHIIDTSPYKHPAIADIISFDRKIKLYTYAEVAIRCSPNHSVFDNFERIEINGKKRYIKK
jgi:hypothetical protein